MNAGTLMLVASEQLPEDVGKSGPIGLALTVGLLIVVLLLGRSMARHLKNLPASFDPADAPIDVPDDASELFEPRPGEELLEVLRRQPLAIEAPRPADPDGGDRPPS